MRPVHSALAFFCAILVVFLATFADAALRARHGEASMAAGIELVERLGLTDLALFSEARYARHPSQADLHSAFQDHPAALEHFPSGSLVRPPGFTR